MQVATGTVIDGKVVVEGLDLAEGQVVTILTREPDEEVHLSLEDEAELLEAIARHEVPANFVEAITAETGGNPFFLREVLLHLVEEGKLEREAGRFISRLSIEEMGIPEGVRQVIGRRLSRLSKETNGLVSAASGCSGAFHLVIAAGAAGLEEAVALDALDEALEAQLLRATGEPEVYDFTHALIRHTLYGELSPSRQVRLHRRLAEEMERVYGNRIEHAAEIAHQWHRSSAIAGAERGVPHCFTAADTAQKAAAHEEAAAFLGMALDLLPEGDSRRPRLLARRALALAWSLRNEEAVRVASEAADLLAASEGRDAAADYLAEAAPAVYGSTFDPRAWPLAQHGLGYVGGRRDLTWAMLASYDLDRREAADPEFPGIPLDVPERHEISRILTAQGLELFGRSVFVNTFLFDSREDAIKRGGTVAGVLAFWAGEYERASTLGSEITARNLERGRLDFAVLSLSLVARCQAALGNLASSRDAVSQGNALLERIGNPLGLSFFLQAAPIGQAFVRGEGYELLLPVFDRIFAENTPGLRWVMAIALAAAASFYAHVGRMEDALRALRRILPAVERAAGWANNYTAMLYYGIEVVWVLGRQDHIDVLERNLREKTLAPDFRYPHTDARLSLARLCALTGRFDEAREWFEKARRVLDEQGARPLRAITDFDEAWMDVRRGAAGNRERALALLDSARGPFESIGMPGWLRRADELRQRLGRY